MTSSLRRREELLLHEAHPEHRQREDQDGDDDGGPAVAHAGVEHAAERPRQPAALGVVARQRRGQDGDAEQRREQHRDDPRHDQRHRDHDEQREGEFACRTGVEADGNEAGDRYQRAREHRECRRCVDSGVDIGRGLAQGIADLEPRHHHLDRDHGIVDQEAERDDQRAERDALQGNAGIGHDQEGDGEHQRDRDRDHQASADAETDEADGEHDDDGFIQRLGEAADRLFDDLRLVGDEMHAHADREIGDDLGHLPLQRLAEVEQVGTGLHADGEPDRGLAVEAEQRRRRILIATGDGRDVGQREEAVADAQIDRLEALLRGELAGDAHGDALRPGLQHAGRRDRVLRLQRGQDGALVDAQRRDLAGGEFEIDHLVLGTDDVDAADIGHRQHLGANLLDAVAQLALAQSVAGEGIDVAEHVAEAVVESRPDHAGRKVALDVIDQVAHLQPGRDDVARLGGVAQVDEHGGLAGHRQALGVVECRQLLELLLDAVGDLPRHLLGGGARPFGLDQHRLDGEGRILLAAEMQVGEQARGHEGDHEIPDQRAMLERPVGEVEGFHG